MAQDLTPLQIADVQQVHRPAIEAVIRCHRMLSDFVIQYDSQQDPILENAEALNDAAGGITPRDDAPQLTGNDLKQLRDLSDTMATAINDTTFAGLVKLAVRDLNHIVS